MQQTDMQSWWRPTLIGVAIVTALRIALLRVSPLDLYVDESQYWFWGQNLDFGYFSKPPMIGWVLRLVDEFVPHRSAFTVRLAAPVFHGATALLLGYWAQTLMPDHKRAGFWVAMAYLSLPIVAVGSFLISTDTIMAPFLVGALILYWRICSETRARHALLGGVLLGLAFMSKYAAIYFLPGAVIAYALYPSMRPSGRSLVIYAFGFAIAASPNILWNFANDLTTVSHTMDNIGWVKEESTGPQLNFAGMLEFAASQFAVFGPVFMVLWLIAVFAPAPSRRKALIWFSIPVWTIVLIQALLSRAYANWAFAAIPVATIVAILWALETKRRKALWAGYGINIAMTLILAFLTTFPMATTTDDGQPFAKRYVNISGPSLEAIALARANGIDTVVATRRDLIADLFFTGAEESDLTYYSTPAHGAPHNYYQQKRPLPEEFTGSVLYVSVGDKLVCNGQDIASIANLRQQVGTWAKTDLPAYIVEASCLR